MKKLVLLFATMFLAVTLMAQEPAKQQEIGLSFYSLNGFGITYKTGTEKALWRFNSIAISGDNNNYSNEYNDEKTSDTSFGISFGKEFRKALAENFELRYGADLSFRYDQSSNRIEYKENNPFYNYYLQKRETYTPGLNLVFGINYIINDKLVIGAELLPGFGYSFGTATHKQSETTDTETEQDISGYNLRISSSSALLSIAYRF